MNKRKYKIGDIVNGRVIKDYISGCYVVSCQICGATIRANVSDLENNVCRCAYIGNGQRFSGRQYVNPKIKIELLKRKYKNGITDDIINELINSIC